MRIIIFAIIGGIVGFGIHLTRHYFTRVDLFSSGPHAIQGVTYALAGIVMGAMLSLIISRARR